VKKCQKAAGRWGGIFDSHFIGLAYAQRGL